MEPKETINVAIESRNIESELTASICLTEESIATGNSNVLKQYHEVYEKAQMK